MIVWAFTVHKQWTCLKERLPEFVGEKEKKQQEQQKNTFLDIVGVFSSNGEELPPYVK